MSAYRPIQGDGGCLGAETMAFLYKTLFLKEMPLLLSKLFNSDQVPLLLNGLVLDLIFGLMSNLTCQVQHVNHSANSLADSLALLGRLSESEIRLMHNVSMSLKGMVI
ncbi:hypothetical protein HS088_TW16G00554 [Tripterygium wilfordii]|uniref:Uncharacterized protein n=1 Tax=Tripterygium wilfordii TaxID=458696 RepID=A0A7J7CJ74_TRIWF|nr:hypothetical protein HS088_TW16G00554 [Tripterygium wilfordii]